MFIFVLFPLKTVVNVNFTRYSLESIYFGLVLCVKVQYFVFEWWSISFDSSTQFRIEYEEEN